MILKQVMRVYPFGTRNEEIEVSIPSLCSSARELPHHIVRYSSGLCAEVDCTP